MRLTALLVTATLAADPALAAAAPRPSGQTAASSAPDSQSPAAQTTSDPKEPQQSLNLPVSVNRIRQALAQPAEPLIGLRGLDETPTFRVEIRERLKIDELLQSLNYKSGPAVPGGLYAYEQQRQLFPAVNNPLAQPYAAFSQGELVTILVETLLGRYLAGRAMNAISSSERARAEAAAKEEVTHAIAEYCAAQPDHGAGIRICTPSPQDR
jgi:hypothetical protein